MENKLPHWSKIELKIYILLLCAKADGHIVKEEIDLIKSKTDQTILNRIQTEFDADDEDTSFDKIEYNIGHHEFSPNELNKLKKEVLEVFASDHKFQQKERYLDQVLDNILY